MSGDLEKRLRDHLDKEEIKEVLYRYCRGIDRLDEELIASIYHPDGVEHHGAFQGLGSEFARIIVVKLRELFDCSQFGLRNVYIDLDGDTAYTEGYMQAVAQKDGKQMTMYTRFIDRFERRDGGPWKIAKRVIAFDFSTVQDATERYAGEVHFPHGQRDRSDISYRHNRPA